MLYESLCAWVTITRDRKNKNREHAHEVSKQTFPFASFWSVWLPNRELAFLDRITAFASPFWFFEECKFNSTHPYLHHSMQRLEDLYNSKHWNSSPNPAKHVKTCICIYNVYIYIYIYIYSQTYSILHRCRFPFQALPTLLSATLDVQPRF